MIEVKRVVHTPTPVDRVAAYLSDFTKTAEWDPHTSSCTRADPDEAIRVGAEYDNVQRIGPMHSTFRYRVQEYEPGRRILLASSSGTLDATDEIAFASGDPAGAGSGTAGTAVSYTARLNLKGIAKVAEPLLRRMMNKFADDGAAGMQRRLDALPRAADG